MEKMDARFFWMRVDSILVEKQISLAEFCRMMNISKNTLYAQRKRRQIPKFEQLNTMERLLNTPLLSESTHEFSEYIFYLEQANEWQIKAVRQILNMPELKQEEQKYG